MRISEAFPSNYLKAADLRGENVTVTIERVAMEEISGGEHKPVVYFEGKERGLVLNKTNGTNISLIYGDDTDGWTGKAVVLFPTWVDFQGRSVEAIRVRGPQPKDGGQPAPAPDPAQQGPVEDGVPF